MTVFLVIIYVLVCVFLILVVLLQQGKGADLAGAFGGGGSQTSFGPRTTTNIMHRLTTVSFVLFVVLSISLAILSGKRHRSVMEGVDVAAPVPAAAETGEQVAPVMGEPAEESPAGETAPGGATQEPADQEAADQEPPVD